jgi:predicted nucleotidyltransferase
MQNFPTVETKIPIDYEKIVGFCQRWKIIEFALFGSVLRDDFQPDSSDIDVLISSKWKKMLDNSFREKLI